jgi:hypothetical protein
MSNKNELKGFLLALFLWTILVLIIILYSIKVKNKPLLDDEFSRIETIESGKIDGTYMQYIITVDRETDVEYLIIYRGDNMAVTLMRDKGGMVLLRE